MNIFKMTAVATLLLSSVAVSHASVSIATSFEAEGVLSTLQAGANTIDFEASTVCPTEYDCLGDYEVRKNVDGSVNGSAAPFMATPIGQNWLTVPNPNTNGFATFTLSADYDYFGMFWGSIDTYNSISFYDDGTQVGDTITGSEFIPLLANGNQSSWDSNRFINFEFTGGTYNEIRLTSQGLAFETDNHAYGNVLQSVNVSSPSAFVLVGLGLLGLGMKQRRSK